MNRTAQAKYSVTSLTLGKRTFGSSDLAESNLFSQLMDEAQSSSSQVTALFGRVTTKQSNSEKEELVTLRKQAQQETAFWRKREPIQAKLFRKE